MLVPTKFTISAPGKVILFGEHGVIYGKRALAASINKRTTLIFETTLSDVIEVSFSNLDLETFIPVNIFSTKVRKLSDWLNVEDKMFLNQCEEDVTKLKNWKDFTRQQKVSLKCVFFLIRGLFANDKIVNSFKIKIQSELAVGAGTGSSASFSVCISAAFYKYLRIIEAEDEGLFSSEDYDVIDRLAFACEQIIHGRASGIDNFICTYGSMAVMQNSGATGGERKTEILKDIKLRVLLINTGVGRNTSDMVQKVASCRAKNQVIVDFMLNAMDEVVKSACTILKQLKLQEQDYSTPTFKILFSQFEELITMNQGLLFGLGVSNESLNSIVTVTDKFNLHSKLTGAGGGGYAFTVVPPYYPEHDVQQCIRLLEKSGYGVDDLIVGDEGVRMTRIF